MPTGYEVGMYEDIKRIRVALETIADVMKSINTALAYAMSEEGGLLKTRSTEQEG